MKITDLRLLVKPGVRQLVWSVPKNNVDNSKPADLTAFSLRLKKLSQSLDSCRYCDEGFFDYQTINFLKPEIGYRLGDFFYYPLPVIEKGLIYIFSVSSLNSRGWRSDVSNKLALLSLPELSSPLELVLTPSASIVELSWVAPHLPDDFSGDLRYRVYRRQP
ncbi:hypothetical protein KAI46_08640, partial [bacterium]|nr:hypothetical protein [bacterium]